MEQVCCAQCNFCIVLRVMLLDDGGTFCSYSLRGAGPDCRWLLRFRYALHRYVLVQDETPPPNTSCSYLNPCVPSILFTRPSLNIVSCNRIMWMWTVLSPHI